MTSVNSLSVLLTQTQPVKNFLFVKAYGYIYSDFV